MSGASEPASLSVALSGSLRSWQSTAEGIYWRLVNLDDTALAAATNLLDNYAAERATRFRFQRDRDRYVAAQVNLRLALSELLDQPPESIEIRRGPHGKPALSPDRGWAFNLSHSDGLAVIAAAPMSRAAQIGVDIECTREIADWQALARDHFSEAEYGALVAASDIQRSPAFLRCWTRKEACVKAIGSGLTIPVKGFSAGILSDQIIVSIDTDETIENVAIETIFEHESCIISLAWCPVARPSPIGTRQATA